MSDKRNIIIGGSKFTVESGIPIPAGKNSDKVKSDLLHEMKPGESFLLNSYSMVYTMRKVAKMSGIKITARKTSDKKWRV